MWLFTMNQCPTPTTTVILPVYHNAGGKYDPFSFDELKFPLASDKITASGSDNIHNTMLQNWIYELFTH